MATLGALHTRLLVSDVEACTRFYRDVLGFELTLDAGVYAELRAGSAMLALYKRQLMAEVVGETDKPTEAAAQDRAALVFEVDDVEAVVRQLKAKGARLIVEPTDRPEWVRRTAHVRDPGGNLIEINTPLTS